MHKRRRRYVIDECMVEMTEIATGGSSTRTVAVESPDTALVSATVAKLGLQDRRNVCVARGLKAMIGFGTQVFGVIDVGTNSVKFHLAERRADGAARTVVDRAEVTRLGEGLDETGELTEPAVQRTVDAIAGMVDEARRHDAAAIAAVGTAGLRIAPNRQTFLDAVKARAGIDVEVISGEEEGRLAYVAATSALPLAARPLGRVRLGWRQQPVHASARDRAWTSASASTSVPCASPNASVSPVPSSVTQSTRRWRRSPAT